MTRLLFYSILLFSVSAVAIPDIPPDASGEEYRAWLGKYSSVFATDDDLDEVMQVGERNLDWLKYINSFRPQNPLSFKSKETQVAYPIYEPNEYNPQIILGKFKTLKEQFPVEMSDVVFNGKRFTKEPPLPVVDYIKWGLELDKAYQSASRWQMNQPFLSVLEQRRKNDMRGYYFLSRMKDRQEKLASFDKLSKNEQEKIYEWLVEVCMNSGIGFDDCRSRVKDEVAKPNELEKAYQSYHRYSESKWNWYFTLDVSRPDYVWKNLGAGVEKMIAPFLDPSNSDVLKFVQFHVQDEWRFGKWSLELPIVNGDKSEYTHIVFEPGATPHVDVLGGKIITMDANRPLTDYDTQFAIRHEFGHTMGFKDCYVEFYVKESDSIINYQLDIDDIMCSRRGRVKENHFLELKRVYGQKK